MLQTHTSRLVATLKATGIHLAISIAIAFCSAAFIFYVWYPAPFDQLANGRSLITLISVIYVVCGPLLTSIVFNPRKPKAELRRDLALIVLFQLGALGYGFYSAMQARPVWLAFEGDRFRMVSVPDIDLKYLPNAPAALRNLSLTGPKFLGVLLVDKNDASFPESVLLSAQGFHPAFRPSRWLPYETQIAKVVRAAKPLSSLNINDSEKKNAIEKSIKASKLDISSMGYIPLATDDFSNWTVIVNLNTGKPLFYLPVDSW